MPANKALRKARAERIRRLRKLTNMSRTDLADKYNIPYPTMQNWEDGRFGGLSKKGAGYLSVAFRREGVPSTAQWLLYGEGTEPQKAPYNLALMEVNTNGYDTLTKELQSFYENNPNAIHMIVKNNHMQPRFHKGEYLAGVQHHTNDIEKYFDEDCILQTKMGKTIACRFREDEDEDYITLYFLNPVAKEKPFKKSEILYFAPVVWARKQD